MTQYQKELILADKIVKEAYKIPEWFKNKGFKYFEKQDKTPVTYADLATQIFIISELKKGFPNDQIIAEEEGSLIDENSKKIFKKCFKDLNIDVKSIKDTVNYRGGPSERQWSIDPIDGTQGFVEGLSYAVGLGFMVNSNPKVCAIAVPNYNEDGLAIFTAEKDQGARASYGGKDAISIYVSVQTEIEKIRMCHSLHYDKPWVMEFAEKVGIKQFIQIDSMLKYCMVADGSADLYIKPLDPEHTFTWDFMPGDLIVREAGGKITDLKGAPLKFKLNNCIFTAPGYIASNEILHEKILNLIRH